MFSHSRSNRIQSGRNRPGRHKQRFNLQLNGRFKFLIVLSVCVVFVSAWQFIKPGLNNFTPVENVRIVSAFKNIPLSELRQQVMSVLSGGYFTVDIDAIRNRLLDLPWVEDVSVRRQWPSGLHIRVIEKQAVAYWGETSLLSNRGELFTPVSVGSDQSLPQLEGPEGFHQKVWAFLQEINRATKPMDIKIKKLALDERRAWMLSIANNSSQKNIEIRLGRANIDHRLARFVSIFSNRRTEFNDIGFIDLRYPNGFAMGKAMGQKMSKENVMRNTGTVSRRIDASQALKRGAAV